MKETKFMKDQFLFDKERIKAWFDIELKGSCPKIENGLTITIKCLDLRFSNTNSFETKFSNVLQIYLVDFIFMVFLYELIF